MNSQSNPRSCSRRAGRALVSLGIATGAAIALASPAFAHVGAATTKSDPDGTTAITFSFDESCDDHSAVKSLTVNLPSNASNVKAEDANGWTAKVTAKDIIWSGPPIADKTESDFPTTMKLSGTKGDTVYFPSVKTCETDVFKATDTGANAGDTAAPSVQIGVVDATVGGPTTTANAGETTTTKAGVTTTAGATTTTAAVVPVTSDSSSSNTPLIIGAIVVVVVVVGGGTAYALTKKG
jgi:periplasmic copper chaperone A